MEVRPDMDASDPRDSVRQVYLGELGGMLRDPIHRRLIDAYEGQAPKESMEKELADVLMEILGREG